MVSPPTTACHRCMQQQSTHSLYFGRWLSFLSVVTHHELCEKLNSCSALCHAARESWTGSDCEDSSNQPGRPRYNRLSFTRLDKDSTAIRRRIARARGLHLVRDSTWPLLSTPPDQARERVYTFTLSTSVVLTVIAPQAHPQQCAALQSLCNKPNEPGDQAIGCSPGFAWMEKSHRQQTGRAEQQNG